MILKEFFGRPVNVDRVVEKNRDLDSEDLFFYILHNDPVHRKHFFPLARKIKKAHKSSKFDKKLLVKEFMPMVKDSCKEYYEDKKLSGYLKNCFPKELREELCEKLFDHFYEDILKDNYNLGN
jgi:hypothetical protein